MQTELEKKITDTGLKPDNALNVMRCVDGFMGTLYAWYGMATGADKEREIRELELMLFGAENSMAQFGISENDTSIARMLFVKEVESIPVYIARSKNAERERKRRAARTPEQIERDRKKDAERRAARTPEQIERDRARNAEYMRRKRAARTPEQIEADRAKARARMRKLYNERKRRAVADNQR